MTETQPVKETEVKITQEQMDELTRQAIADKAKESKPSRLGLVFTPEGEKVQWSDGRIEEPEEKPFALALSGWKDSHHQAMLTIAECVRQIIAKGRKVPLTRTEAEQFGLTKKVVKELERYGLVKAATVPLVGKNGKRLGGRALVFFTPQGNAYIRECRVVAEAPSEAEKPLRGEGPHNDRVVEPELGPKDPNA